jgi:poly-gamma-glutamate capsule biosynthesis protein CapA/YwtB (metallophosphatase superfamily)
VPPTDFTVGLLGDVMLGRGVAAHLEQADPASVWSPEVAELARSCDLLVANLECCISDRGRKTRLIRRKPFFFRAPPTAIDSLRAIGVDAVSVANNHALDYGPDAFADTLEHLARAGIAIAGARGGAEVEAPGVTLGVAAVTDHPTEYATWVAHADLRAGTPDWLRDELERLRAECQLVVAFPHWGPNMTTRPERWQRERARDWLAAGADIVAGHSAHVFHGVERLDDGLALYDLGDALDDYAVDPHVRNDLGVMALWRPAVQELELVGLRLDYCHTRLAEGDDADWIARRLERACAELGSSVKRTAEQRFLAARGGQE